MNWKSSIKEVYRHEPAVRAVLMVLGAMLLLVQMSLAARNRAVPVDTDFAETPALSWNPETVFLTSEKPATDYLVEAVIQVESGGNPRKVGRAGERGLMQIKKGTWREVTRRLYGKPISFDRAFEPELNRIVGRAYLEQLREFVGRNRNRWRTDELSLVLACYNAGPTRVERGGFSPAQWPAFTRDYVQRVTALHERYVAEGPPAVRMAMARVRAPLPSRS